MGWLKVAELTLRRKFDKSGREVSATWQGVVESATPDSQHRTGSSPPQLQPRVVSGARLPLVQSFRALLAKNWRSSAESPGGAGGGKWA